MIDSFLACNATLMAEAMGEVWWSRVFQFFSGVSSW